MEYLRKIAEEQIKILTDLQGESYMDVISASRDIRNWCKFIKELDRKETALE